MKNIFTNGASEFVQDIIDSIDISYPYALEGTESVGCMLASYEDLRRIFKAMPITRGNTYAKRYRCKSRCVFYGSVGDTIITVHDDIDEGEGDFKGRNVWSVTAKGDNIALVLDRLAKITDRHIAHHLNKGE